MQFSIVTPSYNQAKFLENTICSVLNQSYKDFEFIVVDGGSSDNSRFILSKYGSQLTKTIIEQDDGQADAINKGFVYATGEICAYLNSDDYYFSDALEKVAKAFHDNPDVDVVYGDCVYTDENGQFLRYFSDIADYSKQRLLNNTDFIMQPAAFWRKTVFDRFGPFDKDLHFGFDWAFWCELAQHNCNFLRINEVLAANRVYASTKTLSGSHVRLQELKKINYKYKTKRLPHAYYGFSREEYFSKRGKKFADYFLVLMYLFLSYQNVAYYFRSYNKKIINGLLPKTRLLLKRSRIKLPSLRYSRLHVGLSSPFGLEQEVLVYSHGELLGKYHFKRGVFDLEINLDNGGCDVDVRFEFTHEYAYTQNVIMKLLFFYKPSKIAATLNEFTMS